MSAEPMSADPISAESIGLPPTARANRVGTRRVTQPTVGTAFGPEPASPESDTPEPGSPEAGSDGSWLQEGFDRASRRYDLMVALNPGYHRHLRAAADALIERLPDPEPRLVDLGCGSGASTRALVDAVEATRGRAGAAGVQLVGVDASAGMLARARAKRWPAGVRFEHGLAEDVATRRSAWGMGPARDGVFAAYLFRNVADRDHTLRAAFEVLRPGGQLVTQEYSVSGNTLARRLFTLVCWTIVIPLSVLTYGGTSLYRYLWRSVLDFDSVEQFTERLEAAGFVGVEVRTVPGWQRGILHTFRAHRPLSPTTPHPAPVATPSGVTP